MAPSPTIRELVSSIRSQPGVEAVVVLGRDGLVIESESAGPLDSHELAARARTFLDAADGLMPLDTATEPYDTPRMVMGVLEYPGRYGVVSVLSGDAILLVLAAKGAREALGPLLYQLRSCRDEIAALV